MRIVRGAVVDLPESCCFGGGRNRARLIGVSSQADEIRARVRRFAVRVLRFVKTLPRDPAIDTVVRQFARSGTGISSNYHAAGRARSRAEFIAKMGVVAEEADETEHWLDVMREGKLASGPEFDWLTAESRELRAIFVQPVKTARSRVNGSSHR